MTGSASRHEPGTAIDPVCGMSVSPGPQTEQLEHAGVVRSFCSAHCKARFAEDPDAFLGGVASPPPPPAGAGGPYTCPMHPEVERDGPGACPICGMDLVSTTGPQEGADPDRMRLRLVLSAILTLPVFLLAMGEHLGGGLTGRMVGPARERWIELMLTTGVVLWGGWPLLVRGWTSVRGLRLNMFTLIALGVVTAWGYSLVAVLAPGLFPAGFRDAGGQVDVYFEAAAVIVTLVLLGQVLEARAHARTGAAIRALLDLSPKSARRVGDDGREEDVPLEEVRVGDRLRVRPGEKVPVDAEVLEGHGSLDESMITGESMPVERGPGQPVIGGTLNGAGSLLVRAERVGSETLLARIVGMVSDAQRSRAPIQRLVDVVAAWFVPAVVAAAVVTFALWATLGPEPRLAHALVNGVAVLIVACPCALGLATPVSIMVASGRGAQVGVLFRNAEAIERLRQVDTLLVDKTGTLTLGRPALTRVETTGELDEAELLALAAGLEARSEHPLAGAIVRAAEERGLAPAAVEGFEARPGRGVAGRVGGRRLLLGGRALLEQEGVASEALRARADALRGEGASVVFAAVEGRLAGLFAISDPIKERTRETLDALRAQGLRIVMLSGDDRRTAEAVARALGIEEVLAEVLPEDKLREVERLQREGRTVAMAGDGINDAPALARADVGIAMGSGTDVAMETAAVTLVKGDLRGIGRAVRLSHATMRNVRQNLFFAFCYNAAGVPLAAGVLYPWTGLLLHPMIAAAAMSFSSVSVLGNALRLRRVAID